MKIKTVVTGKNRKQLRSLCLELNAKLECASLDNMLVNKKYKDLEKRHMALAKLNEQAEKELHEAKVNLAEAVDKNAEMAEDHFKLSQENIKTEDKLKLANLTIEARDQELLRLRTMLSDLTKENKQLKEYNEKPLWKKVFRC